MIIVNSKQGTIALSGSADLLWAEADVLLQVLYDNTKENGNISVANECVEILIETLERMKQPEIKVAKEDEKRV